MTKRRGFTLTELLITVVLLGILGAGITNMLSSQMRFFQRSTGARNARAVTRNAVNFMRNEMRMIEPRGITAATATSITVSVPYRLGVHCSASTGTFVPLDSVINATAVYAGYMWRDTAAAGIWTYVPSTGALAAGNATSCTAANPGMSEITGGTLYIVSPALVAPPAAPMMLYQTITYSFAPSTLVPGRTALWRTVTGGSAEEIAVPFDAGSTIRFYVNGGTTSQTAVPGTLNTITGIEFDMTAESERSSPGTNAPETSASRVSIFFRNSVN
jgi:prepilin-type N-terminal cleavage/methylation domain-containing protein